MSHAAAMNFDFIKDLADDAENSPATLTGWESIVFELEDEPADDDPECGGHAAALRRK